MGEQERYKLWWSRGEESRNGVSIMAKKELLENVIEVIRINDKLMKIMMVLRSKMAHIFSAYAPQQGRPEEKKRQFRELLEDKIAEVPEADILIVGGDMNAHVGQRRDGFENEMECFGLGGRGGEGEELLRICQENNLKVVSTWFKKKREHLITYKSGDLESQIVYIMLRQSKVVNVKNCKVILGEAFLTQHRLLCCDSIIKNMKLLKTWRGE